MLNELGRLLVLAAVYFLAARFGLALAFAHTSISPVWPPTGIALASTLIWGYRVWPGIWLGAFRAKGVVTLLLGSVRPPEHGQDGLGGDGPGQRGRAARAGDDHLDPFALRG